MTGKARGKEEEEEEEIGQLCSDTIACNLCFSVDLDVATFISNLH